MTWAYRTAFKATTQNTPFQVTFRLEAIAPFEFNSGSPRVRTICLDSPSVIQASNMSRLTLLEESRMLASNALGAEQNRRKAWHDRHLRKPQFKEGDLVLLYQTKYLKRAKKLIPAWQGLYLAQGIVRRIALELGYITWRFFYWLLTGRGRHLTYYLPHSEGKSFLSSHSGGCI